MKQTSSNLISKKIIIVENSNTETINIQLNNKNEDINRHTQKENSNKLSIYSSLKSQNNSTYRQSHFHPQRK